MLSIDAGGPGDPSTEHEDDADAATSPRPTTSSTCPTRWMHISAPSLCPQRGTSEVDPSFDPSQNDTFRRNLRPHVAIVARSGHGSSLRSRSEWALWSCCS